MLHRRWPLGLLVICLALAALSLGPHPQAASASGLYSYTFEESLKPWTEGAGSFLTLDRSDNVCPLEHGTGMALLAIPVRGSSVNGGVDEIGGGFAYMSATFPANAGDTVTVDWAAKSIGNCGAACRPVVYAGQPGTPSVSAFAAVPGTLGAYGWTNYHYTTGVSRSITSSSGAASQVSVALGLQRKPALLGGALGIDCVFVTITANSSAASHAAAGASATQSYATTAPQAIKRKVICLGCNPN